MTVVLLLGACADEAGPTFAPDAGTETAISALTPTATATGAAIDLQPGERDTGGRTIAELAAARGTAAAVSSRDGDTLTVFDAVTGVARPLPLTSEVVGAAVSADGTTIVTLRRDGAGLTLDVIGPDGSVRQSVALATSAGGTPSLGTPSAGTPSAAATPSAGVATPSAGVATPAAGAAVMRERVELSPDGVHAAIVSDAGDLFLVTLGPAPVVARVVRDFGDVTAMSWSGDGTLALVATFDSTRSTSSITGVPMDGRLRSVLRLPTGDGRRVVTVASPAGSPDVFYVARSASGDWTAQNNLYRIPLVGGVPSVVVATGLIGPAGAVDRLAVSDDGRTIAVTLLVPSGSDLTFHSLWVTDVETATPLEVDVGALGLVSRIAWTPDGLLVVGVQRERSASATRLVTVVERLGPDGSLAVLDRVPSAATPVASPAGSPAASPIESQAVDPTRIANPATPGA